MWFKIYIYIFSVSENVDLWSNVCNTTVVLSKFQYLSFYLLLGTVVAYCRLQTVEEY